MSVGFTLAGLALALSAIPAGRRWRRFAWEGARARAHHEALRFTLALAAATVLFIMATGRFA